MSNTDKQKSDNGHAYKCCGISMDPDDSLSYEEICEGLTKEEISRFTHEVNDFLKREGFEFLIN